MLVYQLFVRHDHHLSSYLFILFVALMQTKPVRGQSPSYGIIQGIVKDGAANSGLPGVTISVDDTLKKSTVTLAGGKYILHPADGVHTLYFKCPGYQTKIINKQEVYRNDISRLDIVLLPLKVANSQNLTVDSANNSSEVSNTFFVKEKSDIIYNPLYNSNTVTDIINSANISSGTEKNTSRLLNRLNYVTVQNSRSSSNTQSLQISGMGERYNQVLLNGSIFNSADAVSRSYPLELLPAEAIEQVLLHKTSQASLPADFAGGTIEIMTKDMPERNFYLAQIGAGFASNTTGKDFFGDKRNSSQLTSFPGSIRNLPGQFPTTRSQNSFSEKNVQERTDLSKLLNNNLGPVNYGKAEPDDRVLFGFGKIYKLKKGLTIGVIGFLNHIKEEVIEESVVQVAPDISNNPFPFSDPSKKLINSQANDLNYNYSAQLGGTLNAAFYFRNNKISIRNYLGNQFYNTLSLRKNVSKPDEDTLANAGIRHTAEQRKFWYAQIAGEHTFGEKTKFTVDWQTTYNYTRQQNPDERNFLLRQSNSNKELYEIARPSAPDINPPPQVTDPSILAANFTNSSRLWRDFTENNFTGSVNIRLPVNLLSYTQIIKGGLYVQNTNRDFVSDLLLVKGEGYTNLNNLLAPEKYFPGGVSVTNYYSNISRINNNPVTQNKRGNYFGAANVAASYLQLENHFLKNLYLHWGIRLESNNQSTATVQYEYAPGYRFPQKFVIDDNTRQVQFSLLPAANMMYAPVRSLHINAAYAKTINRPLLQEMSAYNYYDAASFLVRTGNPFLGNALINNYNAGAKWLVDAGTYISLSGFYKEIDQPIEDVMTKYSAGNMQSTPYNMPPAVVKGLQADLRLKLSTFSDTRFLSNIALFASGVLQKSEVQAGPLRSTSVPSIEGHSLTGTPDYSFNAGIIIQDTRFPELSVVYNKTADIISKVGSGNVITLSNGNKITAVPDYRIKGRGQLDIQLAQKIFKSKMQIIAGVTNLLDESFIEYQDLNGNKKFDAPLSVTSDINNSGFYKNGIDNTIHNIKLQRNFYVRLSWLF
jgi:outer membrane receptor protein involved in Fe transport